MTPFAVICDAERIGTYENGQFPTQNVTERMQCLSISISERIGTQAVSVQSWCVAVQKLCWAGKGQCAASPGATSELRPWVASLAATTKAFRFLLR